MRKKDIFGHFVKKKEIVCACSIKEIDEEGSAFSALVKFLPGCKDYIFNLSDRQIHLAGDGCKWLIYLPMNEYWALTAFYSPENEIQEWYFDISKGNFMDENGRPCTDDIFLDLVILPDGHTMTVDADELRDALDKNEITIDEYNHAYRVHDSILNSKWNDIELLRSLSNKLLAEYD